jgi:general nucleoside transport system ATP-binding protein
VVFQHFSLFDNLTVAQNVALGLPPGEPLAAVSRRLAEVSRDYGLPLDSVRDVWRLSVGERQHIEIVRALMQNLKLLILDEPTSVLTPLGTDGLFATPRRLRDEGRASLYISHKLDDVRVLCDAATILRGGRKVGACNPRGETAVSLARMMVGADIARLHIGKADAGEGRTAALAASAGPRLAVHDLTLDATDLRGVRLERVSLKVHGGEIVGIAGVSGNGQDELFAALSGERPAPADSIAIDGRPVGLAGVLGYTASFPIPEVISGINATMLGAWSVNPGIKVKIIWVNTWLDPGKEADAAKALLDQGADIIMQHTDSPAAMQVAA